MENRSDGKYRIVKYRIEKSERSRVTEMEEGQKVYYIEDGTVYSGKITDIEYANIGMTFSIDSYGGCEGNYRIASSQLGKTVFDNEEAAEKALKRRTS